MKNKIVGDWKYRITALILLAFGDVSALTETAFMAGSVSAEPVINIETTRGWGFMANREVLITQVGVFDDGGDGLAKAHEVGLWEWNTGGGILLASGMVPPGTEAPLINGYRYTSLSPIILPPSKIFMIGGHYDAGDADDLVRPIVGGFAPEISVRFPGSVSLGRALMMPNLSIPRGGEGSGTYEFFPVNFQFAVIPEPSTGVLLAAGLLGVFMLNRRKKWM